MTNQNQIQKAILDELGLSNLPQERKDQLMIKMTEAVLQRIFSETTKKLTDSKKKEYGEMVDSGASPEKINVFLRENIINYEKMVAKVIFDFKEEMKARK